MAMLAESSRIHDDPRLHWHFRTMPSEIQRSAIRRLALSGLADKDIAERIGWPVDRVRLAISEDECVRDLMLKGGSAARAVVGWRRADHFSLSE